VQDTRGRCPNDTFRHPDVGLIRVFWSETSECVCQGLRNVLEFAGGVPRRAVFGQRHRGRRAGRLRGRALGPLPRFAAHYGLDYTFTNPYSGNEKGNVENKVGCHRRNLFVPVPSFHDVRAFNGRLLKDCLDPGDGKRHHGLEHARARAARGGRSALSPLPPAPFSCVR
jgi:transposase